jgi:hypothetical protein
VFRIALAKANGPAKAEGFAEEDFRTPDIEVN